jgi:hypothetical protein
MNPNQPTKLAIFDKGFFEVINSQDEFTLWKELQEIFFGKKYKEATIEEIKQEYFELIGREIFGDIQLKFYLIRTSNFHHKNQGQLQIILMNWIRYFQNKFGSHQSIFDLFSMATNITELNEYGKYFYPRISYLQYINTWNKSTVDLITWKKFNYLSIPDEIYFLKKVFESNGGITFSKDHMRKLFDEYVNEIFIDKFHPRLKSTELMEKDKSILERFSNNTFTRNDSIYMHEIFNVPKHENISAILSKCLLNEVKIENIDIHSSNCYSEYYAILKYLRALKKPSKTVEKYAMWFKNKPTEIRKKEQFEENQKILFETINKFCPSANWNDFNTLFNKNGSSSIIIWTGNPSILNFIFRMLHDHLEFEGKKWEVISNYFIPNKGEKFDPKKLEGNSHFKDNALEKKILNLFSTLKQ